ncbi:MAG: DUF1569 domain-containing protein [Gemmatimonadaceae bacterium]|nr:DUF1569 domain-containing protein [Gemmatimonadaceae bacterium]
MKNLFDPALAVELTARLEGLRPDSPRLWGKMNAPQAVAHCSAGFEWALGDTRPPRMFVGRIIGGFVKRMALGNDDPFRQNSPTAPGLVVADERELATERTRLRGLIARFSAAGPAGCTTHPHGFFGRLTPDEWAVLMYKHVDHHLRQFGA